VLLGCVLLISLYYFARPAQLPDRVRQSTSINALREAATRYIPALRLVDDDDDDEALLPPSLRSGKRPPQVPFVQRVAADLDNLRPDGRVVVPLAKDGSAREHPIPRLMQRARDRWKALQAGQSKTFRAAILEYRRRNGRNPPKGFDRWCVPSMVIRMRLMGQVRLLSAAQGRHDR
jgi:hypothetical protein